MYATRQRLNEWRAAAGLLPEHDRLVGQVRAAVTAINGAPYNGLFDEADTAQAQALATTLGISVSDLYVVLKWADAIGRVYKVV